MLFIVLNRSDFRENDQLITLFSRESGKEIALARSVKKISSKNSAFLEPFFLVEAEIISGKEIKHIFKVFGVNGFKNIRNNFNKSVSAKKVVDILNKLIPENGKEPVLFDLIKKWLEFVNEHDFYSNLELGFYCQLLQLLGVTPQLNKCVFCEKSLIFNQQNEVVLSVPDGGVLCHNCVLNNKIVNSIILKKTDLNDWKIFLDLSIEKWPVKISRELDRATRLFFEHHSGAKLAKISQIS
jgi:DNA repair protein RecO (recombination protein O)